MSQISHLIDQILVFLNLMLSQTQKEESDVLLTIFWYLQAGGSLGTVFAWDLRWPQQPILLSGVGAGETTHSPCESEVWEVHFDHHAKPSNVGNVSSRILPTMICSEDGILAVVEQGKILSANSSMANCHGWQLVSFVNWLSISKTKYP